MSSHASPVDSPPTEELHRVSRALATFCGWDLDVRKSRVDVSRILHEYIDTHGLWNKSHEVVPNVRLAELLGESRPWMRDPTDARHGTEEALLCKLSGELRPWTMRQLNRFIDDHLYIFRVRGILSIAK